ncbi:hypothetical protein COT64_00435 [Candidatus Shapirobacteria bacterium CG09_land_8_20_14_0_10_39_12]|uniref:DUF5659 domain-containing protein n=1 Tax=Candidatus Shapirobacteria bacterium CG09_land_8_20_14_0_10_39_12 TaxID=1974885 RepID=A0A2H0WSH2_9BACT|nr:MAG: hypothetical protein COT64_00435 [Candidatus Shapirobacteria bacterium CG09_land_8_20_14_0_10_39_12]
MLRQNEYRTKDIYLASFLSLSEKLLRLEKETNFYWFFFENKKRCEETVNNYWQGESKVETKAFVNAIKSLKARVFSGDN